jgi:hypothetical protein
VSAIYGHEITTGHWAVETADLNEPELDVENWLLRAHQIHHYVLDDMFVLSTELIRNVAREMTESYHEAEDYWRGSVSNDDAPMDFTIGAPNAEQVFGDLERFLTRCLEDGSFFEVERHAARAGRDLYFARNGYGLGFIVGWDNSAALMRNARAIGPRT